jgi:hypothetical protein
VGGQFQEPAALYSRNGPSATTGQEAGWASELIWTQRLEEKFFAFVGDRTLVVQSVVRHITDCVTPAHRDNGKCNIKVRGKLQVYVNENDTSSK